jgi:hypothetical protein
VATPNYSYEKRQRELAKKRKKEEKAARKSHGTPSGGNDAPDRGPADAPSGNAPSGTEPGAGA